MSEHQSLAALRQKFHQGRLEREELIAAASHGSAMLKAVQHALDGADIRNIVIEADRIYQTLASGVRMVWQTDV